MNWKEFLLEYWSGLRRTPQIFQRIGFRKRTLEEELNEALMQGNLRKVFSGFDLLMLGLGITIGGGVWQLTGLAANTLAGPSIVISYALAGIASTAAAACYGELAVEYPVAGASFTYVMVTFGEFPAWITVANVMGVDLFGSASLSRSFSSFLAILCGQEATFFTLLGSRVVGTWSVDLMAGLVALLASVLLAVSGRSSSIFTSGVTLVKLGVVLFIIVVTFTRAKPSNLSPFLLDGDFGGVFAAASLFIYTLTGFDSIANAAEEAKNIDSIPRALVASSAITTVLYVLLALGLCMLLPAAEMNPLYGFGMLAVGAGLPYMRYVVATAAVLGCVTGLIVGLFTLSRLVMVVARDWMLPPCLARVSRRTQTPARAQLILGLIVTLVAIFTPPTFLADLVNFGQLLAMWFTINAQMYRRYYPGVKLRFTRHGTVETTKTMAISWVPGSRLQLSVKNKRWLVGLHMVLITLTATGLATWFTVTQRTRGSVEVIGCAVFAMLFGAVTLSMQLLCPLQYQPQRWHIPGYLMPWLPACSIGLIMFGMTGLDKSSWVKIGTFNAIALVFYFVFSLPMSYIKHYKLDFVHTELLNVVDLQFVDGYWSPMPGSDVLTNSSMLTQSHVPSVPDSQGTMHSSTLDVIARSVLPPSPAPAKKKGWPDRRTKRGRDGGDRRLGLQPGRPEGHIGSTRSGPSRLGSPSPMSRSPAPRTVGGLPSQRDPESPLGPMVRT